MVWYTYIVMGMETMAGGGKRRWRKDEDINVMKWRKERDSENEREERCNLGEMRSEN